MKLVSHLAMLLASFVATASSDADDSDTAHSLIGTWRVVAMEAKGRADSGVSFNGMRYTFDHKIWTTYAGDSTPAGLVQRPPLELTYTLNDSTTPKRLTGTTDVKGGTRTLKAIYRIDNGKLILCLGRDDWQDGFDTSRGDAIRYTATRVESTDPETPAGG
jgi:uncharacterized protein (TIGR03067 family)